MMVMVIIWFKMRNQIIIVKLRCSTEIRDLADLFGDSKDTN